MRDKCFHCKLQNPEGTNFCQNCGNMMISNQTDTLSYNSGAVTVVDNAGGPRILSQMDTPTSQSGSTVIDQSSSSKFGGKSANIFLQGSQDEVFERNESTVNNPLLLSNNNLKNTQCEILNCQSGRRVVGICQKKLLICCANGCNRHFCGEHDGKHYMNISESGIVCD